MCVEHRHTCKENTKTHKINTQAFNGRIAVKRLAGVLGKEELTRAMDTEIEMGKYIPFLFALILNYHLLSDLRQFRLTLLQFLGSEV